MLVAVVQQDGDDRDRAKTVERGDVPEPRRVLDGGVATRSGTATPDILPSSRARLPVVAHELDGKVAIVTGSSKGIGRAIATSLADGGAAVMLSSRKQEGLDEAAVAIEQTVTPVRASPPSPPMPATRTRPRPASRQPSSGSAHSTSW